MTVILVRPAPFPPYPVSYLNELILSMFGLELADCQLNPLQLAEVVDKATLKAPSLSQEAKNSQPRKSLRLVKRLAHLHVLVLLV